MDPCPGGQVVQYRNIGENWVQILVQLSLRGADGEGVRTRRVTGKTQKTVETVAWG